MNLQPRLSTTSFEFAHVPEPIGDQIEMAVLGASDQVPLTSASAKIGAPRRMQYPHDEFIGQPRLADVIESPRTLWGWNLVSAGFMFLIFAMALTGMVLGILSYQKNLQQQHMIHQLKACCNISSASSSSMSSVFSTTAAAVNSLTTTLTSLQLDVTAIQLDLASVTACCANSTSNIDALDGIVLALEQCCVDNAQSISALVPSCNVCP